MVTGSRDTTTVAPQALYLLNDPFVLQQSLALAERLLQRTDLDDAGRIQLAYRLTVGRPATAKEIDAGAGLPRGIRSRSRRLPRTRGTRPGPASARRCWRRRSFAISGEEL